MNAPLDPFPAVAGTGASPRIVNGLSVDVEDWFQVGAFETVIARDDWTSLEHRVEANTDRVLALFDARGVKGTFFTLGWIAQRHPAMVQRIARAAVAVAVEGRIARHQRALVARQRRAHGVGTRAAAGEGCFEEAVIVGQVAQTIEHAKLYEAAQARVRELEALSRISETRRARFGSRSMSLTWY